MEGLVYSGKGASPPYGGRYLLAIRRARCVAFGQRLDLLPAAMDNSWVDRCDLSVYSLSFLDLRLFYDVTPSCGRGIGAFVARLYTKPTARNKQYCLQTSLHEASVLRSLPYSQMLRVFDYCYHSHHFDADVAPIIDALVRRGYTRREVDRQKRRLFGADRQVRLLRYAAANASICGPELDLAGDEGACGRDYLCNLTVEVARMDAIAEAARVLKPSTEAKAYERDIPVILAPHLSSDRLTKQATRGTGFTRVYSKATSMQRAAATARRTWIMGPGDEPQEGPAGRGPGQSTVRAHQLVRAKQVLSGWLPRFQEVWGTHLRFNLLETVPARTGKFTRLPALDMDCRNCVYGIQCMRCGAIYVGQTVQRRGFFCCCLEESSETVPFVGSRAILDLSRPGVYPQGRQGGL